MIKRDKRVVCLLGLGLAGLASLHLNAQSFNATYNFANVTTSSGLTDPTPPPVVTGVAFGAFSAIGYSGNPNASGRFSWTQSETGGINADDNFANFTGSLNPVKCLEVTITPSGGYLLDIDTITFGIRRSASGIRNYAVRSSADGFAANLSGLISPANTNLGVAPDDSFRWVFDATSTSADQAGSRVVLGGAFDALSGPVTFRFYGWNAEATSGTFSLDDVLFSGTALTLVPEPGVGALLALGLTAFGLCKRQRFRGR